MSKAGMGQRGIGKAGGLAAFGCALALLAGAAASAPPKARARAVVDGVGANVLSPAVVFAAWDADKDKQLSPEEFSAGWARMERAAMLRQLRGQFDRHDANRNGAIDAAEYASLDLIRKGGASAPALARFDDDKNGALDFKEYVALVAAMAGKGSTATTKDGDVATGGTTARGAAAPAK